MGNDHRPNLFLSHGWEDKDAFVRPLAEALRPEFDVWYDEYALKPGDSLLEKISEGLRSCDRGIVVLSRHFFAKQWPQAELNGLFALETKERKILIPIWFGVTKDDVLNFSPILADRVAIRVSGSEDIPMVVSQIRGVVQGETQTREILGDPVSQRFKELGKLAAQRARQTEMERSAEGLQNVKDEVKRVFDYVEQKADELGAHLKVERARDDNHAVPFVSMHFPFVSHVDLGSRGVATGPHNLTLRFDLTHAALGNLSRCRLGVWILREIYDCGVWQRADRLQEIEFRPEFTESSSKVNWVPCEVDRPDRRISYGDSPPILIAERIVEGAFLRFAEVLEKQVREPT
jgi:hypothetical protein